MDSRSTSRRWTALLLAYWVALIAAVGMALTLESSPQYVFAALLLAGVPLYAVAASRIKRAYDSRQNHDPAEGVLIQFPLYAHRITSDEVSAIHPGNRRPYTRKLG